MILVIMQVCNQVLLHIPFILTAQKLTGQGKGSKAEGKGKRRGGRQGGVGKGG